MKSRALTRISTLTCMLLLTTACQEEPVVDMDDGADLMDESLAEEVATDTPNQPEMADAFQDAIADELTGLMWMRCEHGLSYNSLINWCVGKSVDFEYCSSQDNSCNGETDNGELESDSGSALFEACDSLNEDAGAGGFTNWRVPSAEELATMYDMLYSVASDELPNTRQSWYWSATSDTNRNALIVSFSNGEIGSYPKLGQYPVRCVRDL